jgi:hypothetical protein
VDEILTRDQLAQALMDMFPIEQVFAAAVHLMLMQIDTVTKDDRIEFTRDQIAEFVEKLDFKGLMQLKKIAENIEGGTLQ